MMREGTDAQTTILFHFGPMLFSRGGPLFRAIVALGLGFLLSLSVSACQFQVTPTRDRITPATLIHQLQTDAMPLILDVRPPEEFRAGHVPGAINIPYTALPSHLYELYDRAGQTRPDIIVYCEKGAQSAIAAQLLRRNGFQQVWHLEGDMAAWRSQGLPTEPS